MRHIISERVDGSDVPVAPPVVERRKTPDRRVVWRGGRRDSDWINRPLDGLTRLEAEHKSAWRRKIFSVLHIW
jgi:hypothetical protein